ncbi:MAG: Fe-S oxidoreductase [Desulfobulbus propionicus]|nr:MAG: Fe-S oxidoreductase [Desulfobulbus propionicus]
MGGQDCTQRTDVGNDPFHFHCHPGVSCFLICCHQVDLCLYPYDLIRLKTRLGLSSEEFLKRHVLVTEGSHPFFPGLMLKLSDKPNNPCPFLLKEGCSVYTDRPSACRTYPLERAVEKPGSNHSLRARYRMTHHPYCQGHFEDRAYTVQQWEREQGLHEYNMHNDSWAEMDAFFAGNPWQGEGHAGPLQQLAFMVCFNIDGFRLYVQKNHIIQQYKIEKAWKQRIRRDDGALLLFGYQWLRTVLGGKSMLVQRS